MKKRVVRTTQFKKDMKRYLNQPRKVNEVMTVVEMLRLGFTLPEFMRPHRLVGNYKGCMECHVGSDLLLIWYDETEDTIRLLRLGSHSELF